MQPRRPGAAVAASPWHDLPPAAIDAALLRRAIREERALAITYRDEAGQETERRILPLVLLYYVEVTILAAFCELREDFRHFRQDRILTARIERTSFRDRAVGLRRDWQAAHPTLWMERG